MPSNSRCCLVPLMNPAELEVDVRFDQHSLPRVKILVDLLQQLFLCTVTQLTSLFLTLDDPSWVTLDKLHLQLHTVNRNTQEEPVGDVNHCAAQKAKDVHVRQTAQVVQVSLCGGDANLHCLLQVWPSQS